VETVVGVAQSAACSMGRIDGVPWGLMSPRWMAQRRRQAGVPARFIHHGEHQPQGDTIDATLLQAALLRHSNNVSTRRWSCAPCPTARTSSRAVRGPLPAPYLTEETMTLLVKAGVEHLLVDLPSLDPPRMRGAWRHIGCSGACPPRATDSALPKRPHGLFTELIYVPGAVQDGYYLLDLQIPAFMTDAAPSRPVVLSRGMNMDFKLDRQHTQELDRTDPLASYRLRFHIPSMRVRTRSISAATPWGCSRAATEQHVQEELEDWQRFGVKGHFAGGALDALPRALHRAHRAPGRRQAGGSGEHELAHREPASHDDQLLPPFGQAPQAARRARCFPFGSLRDGIPVAAA